MNFAGVTCPDPHATIIKMGGDIANWSPGPYYVGHKFTFTCRDSQTLLGSKQRTCLATGRWSGLDTICDTDVLQCELIVLKIR